MSVARQILPRNVAAGAERNQRRNGRIESQERLSYRVHDLLTSAELGALTRYVRIHEDRFRPSLVVGIGGKGRVNRASRRSLVLYPQPGLRARFLRKLHKSLPDACRALGLAELHVEKIECQITASNDGDFFEPHLDNATVVGRQLSYVYFFHRSIRPFTGGELRIFANEGPGDLFYFLRHWEAIIPERNMLVWFRSERKHEILPISCPSRQFHDSRFTVNGWVHGDELRLPHGSRRADAAGAARLGAGINR